MIGQTVSHYRILAKLGEGGMGVVYEARDQKLDRTVALKFLPRESTRDPEAKARFIREARTASALDHPNVWTIYEIDETDDGRLFIAMACYAGETLKERLAREPLSLAAVLGIAGQVARGLAKAHEEGIVHRDVKPANIFLTDDGLVKLLDFGLAKLSDQTQVTMAGTTLGTVAFLAPEQARGEEVGPQADIWSLGVTLYDMITGRPPFAAEHEQAVIYSILHEDPAPILSIDPDLPAELEPIVARCLAKKPAERYRSMDELIGDLQRVEESLGTGERALATKFHQPPVARRSTRRRWLVPAAAVLVVGVAAWAILRDKGNEALDPALAIAREAGATMLLSGQIARMGDRQLVTWQLVDTAGGQSLMADRVEESDLILLADEVIGAALPRIRQTLDIETETTPVSAGRIITSSPEAYAHYVVGVQAIAGFRGKDAIRELERATEIDSTFALPYVSLCQYYIYRSPVKTEENWNKAWRLRERLGVKDLMRLEMVKERMKDQPDYHHILRLYDEMLARWPDDRELLRDAWMISGYPEQSNSARAFEYAQRGLAYYPQDVDFMHGVASGRRSAGDFEGALAATRDFVAKHPREPNAWDDLGLAFLALAMPDSAEHAFRQALAIEPGFFFSNWNLARQYYCRGDNAAAIESVEAWLEGLNVPAWDQNYIDIGTDVPVGGIGLPIFYRDCGRVAGACGLFRAALAEESYPFAVYQYVWLLLSLGEAEEALERLRDLGREWPETHLAREGMAYVVLDSLAQAAAIADELGARFERYGSYKTWHRQTNLKIQISLAEGDFETALRLLNEKAAVGIGCPTRGDIDYRCALARALCLAGRHEDAADVLQNLLRVYAGHGQAHLELGKIYEEIGRPGEAAQEYTAFLEKFSEADAGLAMVEEARASLAAIQASM